MLHITSVKDQANVVCVHRDQIAKVQSELTETKKLYVNVCKVKDELENKVRDLQADNIKAKVQTSCSVTISLGSVTLYCLVCLLLGLHFN